jgi:RNA polymerase sigma-70 factor, ECF subfamily
VAVDLPLTLVPPRSVPTVDPRFIQLYDQEHRRITAVVQSLVGRRDVAEEITQDAFVVAFTRWRHIGDYDRPQDFVRRVALNRAVSSLRRGGAERRALVRSGRPVDVEAMNEASISDAPLWQHVRRLPARQAQVIALVYVEDLAIDQVAQVLGISTSSVKTHLQRARSTLAEAMRVDAAPEPSPDGDHR